MKRRLWSSALVCLVAALIGTAGFAFARRAATTKAAPKLQSGWFFPTEQLWIVADISAAIVNMANYANTGTASAVSPDVRQLPRSDGELARFEVTQTGKPSVTVRISDHIWAPASYAPLAARVAGTGAPCAPGDASIAAALLRPTREVIQRENIRVSARLRANMRCADAHAEAALIIGTLALREAATVFYDPRRLISRMTAHLAVADAIGISADNEVRRLSDAVLYTLVGRQQSALDRLDTLDPSGSDQTLQSWRRALRMRNTADWRIVSDPNQASLLEQIELVRAAQNSLGEPGTLDFIDRIKNRSDIPDWARIVMLDARSVEAGNRFSAEAVAMELTEAAEARKTYVAEGLDSAEALVMALKVEPSLGPVGSDGAVWVVDWPMWAAIAERHLMSTINERDTYFTYTVAVADQAKEFREQVARTFSGLRLYPFLAIHLAPTKEEAKPGMAGALTLLQTHPELVTHWMWKTVLMKETWAGLRARVPRLESWFTPAFPSGTVFDANTRPWDAHLVPQFSAAEIAPYRQAAPYARSLPYVTIGAKSEEAPAAVLKQAFGEMAQYNLGFATRIANALKDDPAAYVAAMEPVVRMSPEQLGDVAEYHVQHDQLPEARKTYERWFATGRDEVAIANSSEWMVRDYFDRGEYAKANALADRAAEVYSAGGLLTRARLYDWSGNSGAAERFYRRVNERYDTPGELLGFLLRHHRQGIEVDALKWKVFPDGVVPLSLPMLREAPLSGVEVAAVERIGERYGMHVNDIVVGVDGVRVGNLNQYRAAKAMTVDPAVRLTVWRDLKYTEVTAPIRYGGMWGAVKTYQPEAKKADAVPPRRW